MLNRLNVENELNELKRDTFIKDFKMNDESFQLLSLEDNTLIFETDYESQYKFVKYDISDKKYENNLNKYMNFCFETFESMLTSLSPLYSERFADILYKKLSNFEEK